MNSRTIWALRAIAERPGTKAEGIAARKALKRLDSMSEPELRIEPNREEESPSPFDQFLSSDVVSAVCWLLTVLLGFLGQDLIRRMIGLK